MWPERWVTQGPLGSELPQLGTDHPDGASSGDSRSAEKVTRESWGPSACGVRTCPRVNRSHHRFPKSPPHGFNPVRARGRRVGRGRSPTRSEGYFQVSTTHPSSASVVSHSVQSTGRPQGTSPERRSWGARPRQPRVLGNASSQLPRIRPRHARPEGGLGRPRGCTGGPPGLQTTPGLAGRQAGERGGGGRAARFASPCVRVRQTEPGAAAAATTRRPPPRQERPAAASSSALPQAGRRPTDSSAAAADSHPPGADRRTGPGPCRCLRRRHRPLRAAPAPRPPSLFL